MNKKDFLLKLAIYYKIELMVNVPDWDSPGASKSIINPDIEIVGKWIDSQNLDEKKLDHLFLKITLDFNPTSTVPFPKLGFFDKMLNGDYDFRAERAWNSLKGLSAMDSYLFSDLKIQIVIDSMFGNIKDFVSKKDNKENGVWCKKEFIKLYIDECKNPRTVERKILLGSNDIANKDSIGIGKYGIRYRSYSESRMLTSEEFKKLKISSNKEVKKIINNLTSEVKM